jgi:hypothetical protein
LHIGRLSGIFYPERTRNPSLTNFRGGAATVYMPVKDTMSSEKKSIYRVIFHNQGNIIELYAHEVSQNSLYAFVEVGDIIFGERSKLVVDPSEEQLKSQFSGVKRTYLPLHAVVRIDEVEKEGKNKILSSSDEKTGKITPFPIPMAPPRVD